MKKGLIAKDCPDKPEKWKTTAMVATKREEEESDT